ncbi:IS3 family transposase [Rothia nasisuis]|uniref:IS3 family transposase n=1 Tax=Rothia nasisuis TaxID=2109647 RepID=UPI0034DE2EA9
MALCPQADTVSHKPRGLSARNLREAALTRHIAQVHEENYAVYGICKMWPALRCEGIDIGREQTACLMRLAGVSGNHCLYWDSR